MPKPVSITIPRPCHESWAAMTPTTAGRHCASCQQTVVDFTHQTDAEILAYLARAAGGRTCGRFAAGQLERPLQRAELAAPGGRWRGWLAAAVAVWGLREAAAFQATAQARTEQHRIVLGGMAAVPMKPEQLTSIPVHPVFGAVPVRTLRGVVLDSASREGVPGATVLIPRTSIGVSTDATGHFVLELPEAQWQATGHTLQFSSVGYKNQVLPLPGTHEAVPALEIKLAGDTRQLGEMVIVGGCVARQPWPWHPRALFNWGRYWLLRPFRG